MLINQAASAANRLLTALPSGDRDQLLAQCEQIELVFAEVLFRPGESITHVYFPTQSYISLVTPGDGDAGLEVGLVGNEGMLGITLIQGVDVAPFHAVVQGEGPALRMPVGDFLSQLEQCPALQRELKRYLYVLLSQVVQRAACSRYHLVEARLARWLLMTHDRAHSDSFHLTHVFLATMLGVRRVGITKAANSLQRKRLISYHRGNITILDRIGLEAVSCGCYQTDKEIYEHILG